MFNTWVDYPTFDEELNVSNKRLPVEARRSTPSSAGEEILAYQDVIRRMPVADNVVSYAVNLAASTSPGRTVPRLKSTSTSVGEQVHAPRSTSWWRPKCTQPWRANTARTSRTSKPATLILRHRIVRNYKAEADGVTVEALIDRLKRLPLEGKSGRQQRSAHLSEVGARITTVSPSWMNLRSGRRAWPRLRATP